MFIFGRDDDGSFEIIQPEIIQHENSSKTNEGADHFIIINFFLKKKYGVKYIIINQDISKMRKKYPILRRNKMSGGSFGKNIMKWLGQVNNFLKRSKILTSLGKVKFGSNNPYANIGLDVARQEGYGRRRRVVRRRRMGGSLGPIGGSLRPVGSGITSLAPR